jgi:hypothetical protein
VVLPHPTAPDLQITAAELDLRAIRSAGVFWVTVTGLSQQPSLDAHRAALAARGRSPVTVLDLDYRPMFWPEPALARERVQEALAHATVAVGNREECEVAVGETDPDAAALALLDLGVELAVVKQGPRGVLARTRDERVEVPPHPVEVLNGLGAETRSGAPCATACSPAGRSSGVAVRQRRRCHRRVTAGVLDGHAAHRRGRRPARQRRGSDLSGSAVSAVPVGPRQVSGAPAGGRRATALQVGDLAELRAREPEAVAAAAARRARRPLLGSDGRLLIVAADHPARGALGVRDDPEAMASRPELLSRLRTALCRPGVDGVLGTPDVLEDLLLLGDLEGKVVFGSMNRGGLQGASFELDDRFTAYDAAAIARRASRAARC